MNNLLETIKSRRAIHNYIPNKPIPKETFKDLIEVTSFTPSWYNAQPWEFVIIEDKEKLKKLKEIAFWQEHVTQASAIIVVLWDTVIWRRADELLKDWVKYWYCTEDKVPAYKNAFCKKRKEQRLREMCIRNVSLACMNLMIAAETMWLATCPMLWFNQPSMSDFLSLPRDIIPIMMISIGYEDKWKEKHRLPRRKVEDMLYFEEYKTST